MDYHMGYIDSQAGSLRGSFAIMHFDGQLFIQQTPEG